MSFTVETIPAFEDNYIWLFYQENCDDTYVVDPGDAEPVLNALRASNRTLTGILVTHQHPDHIGGIPGLLEHFPQLAIYGPADISLVNHPVTEGDTVSAGGMTFSVIHVPGHTLNHLAFYAESADNADPVLFCGDTLFAGGCGRLFEGTPQQMLHSLEKLASLPDNTQIYCAHEYTLANLAFAKAVEPDNKNLIERIKNAQQLRQNQQATVPSTIRLEKQTNPFLRSEEESIATSNSRRLEQKLPTPLDVFTATRAWKDNF